MFNTNINMTIKYNLFNRVNLDDHHTTTFLDVYDNGIALIISLDVGDICVVEVVTNDIGIISIEYSRGVDKGQRDTVFKTIYYDGRVFTKRWENCQNRSTNKVPWTKYQIPDWE